MAKLIESKSGRQYSAVFQAAARGLMIAYVQDCNRCILEIRKVGRTVNHPDADRRSGSSYEDVALVRRAAVASRVHVGNGDNVSGHQVAVQQSAVGSFTPQR